MSSAHDKKPEARSVREAAESQLANAHAQGATTAETDLLHELQVHQIELEMQNETLRQTQRALEESRDRYVDLYEFAPVGYISLTADGLIAEVNITCIRLLGRERNALLKRPFVTLLVVPEDRDRWYLHVMHVMQSDGTASIELTLQRGDGSVFPVHLNCERHIRGADATVIRISLTDISERRLAEKALRESELSLATLQSISDAIIATDLSGRIIRMNSTAERLSGWTLEVATGRPLPEVLHIVDAESGEPVVSPEKWVMAHNMATGLINHSVLKDRNGREYQISYNAAPIRNAAAEIIGVVLVFTDVTERRRLEESLRTERAFFYMIAENIADFIAVLDLQGRRLYNSPSYLEFMGADSDLTGSDSFVEVHPDDRERVKKVFFETVATGKGRQIEYRFLRKSGAVSVMSSRGNVIRNSEGKVERVVVVSHDITDNRKLEDKLRQLAFYDALTSLPNRRLLIDRLAQDMATSARSGMYGALMFLDLDNFKPLNDAHGHAVGDLLLIEAGRRLSACVREVDTVSRFGGDEFVLMLGQLDVDRATSAAQAQLVAEKVRVALSQPYHLKVHHEGQADIEVEHHCTASIGGTLFFNHEASQGDVLRWADQAMYQAKEAGRNTVCFFDRPIGGVPAKPPAPA